MSEKSMPLSKTKLLETIAAEYARLYDSLSKLTDEQMTSSGVQDDWSGKDILAHIASWERLATDRLAAAYSDSAIRYPIINNWEGVHAFNATCYQENYHKPLAVIRKESLGTHHNFLTITRKLDDDFIEKSLPFDWADGMTVFELIAANSYWHYKEHYEALEIWMSGQSIE